MLRRKPLKRFRQKRRPGNSKPTAEEAARIVAAKEGRCMACHVRAMQVLLPAEMVVVGCDYNHVKSGNIRVGHGAGYALCLWHHRGHPLALGSIAATRNIYGPSLMDGSRLFHLTYGSDQELIDLQTELLAGRQAA